MRNDSKIKTIEADIEQLRRALTNQNLVASHPGSPLNKAARERIQKKQNEIEVLRNRQR